VVLPYSWAYPVIYFIISQFDVLYLEQDISFFKEQEELTVLKL